MRLKRNLFYRGNDRGDTIVEVLITVAIVSTVLAGAFTVTQRSALAVRDSQERGEMLQILQGQVELVRALAAKESTDTTGVFSTSPLYFCVKNTGGVPTREPLSGFSLPALDSDALDNYAPCEFGDSSRYKIAITYDDDIDDKVFTFTGRWDRVGGGKDQMQLTYRVYPGAL